MNGDGKERVDENGDRVPDDADVAHALRLEHTIWRHVTRGVLVEVVLGAMLQRGAGPEDGDGEALVIYQEPHGSQVFVGFDGAELARIPLARYFARPVREFMDGRFVFAAVTVDGLSGEDAAAWDAALSRMIVRIPVNGPPGESTPDPDPDLDPEVPPCAGC